MQRFRRTGSVSPKVPDRQRGSALHAHRAGILARVEAEPHVTLHRLAEERWENEVCRCRVTRCGSEMAGARLWFLPPFNPIEQAFAKVKHRLRQAQERSTEALLARIGQIADSFSHTECANYIANGGYGARWT